jgi:type VI secretion system protein ImpF
MARTELDRSVQASLVDRLTDLDPRQRLDPGVTRDGSERDFRASVQRDLEWLLNTRRTPRTAPRGLPEVHASVYEFGLRDTTALHVGSPQGRQVLQAEIESTIARFEPRLANVRVRLVDADQKHAPQLRFVIEAMLRMDPNPEVVVFDTVFDTTDGEYAVRDGSGRAT